MIDTVVSQEQFNIMAAAHQKWLNSEPNGIKLVVADMDFSGLNMSVIDLSFAVFNDCKMEHINFSSSKLVQTTFLGCSLLDSSFFSADLSSTCFHSSVMDFSDFLDSKITKTTSFCGSSIIDIKNQPVPMVYANCEVYEFLENTKRGMHFSIPFVYNPKFDIAHVYNPIDIEHIYTMIPLAELKRDYVNMFKIRDDEIVFNANMHTAITNLDVLKDAYDHRRHHKGKGIGDATISK